MSLWETAGAILRAWNAFIKKGEEKENKPSIQPETLGGEKEKNKENIKTAIKENGKKITIKRKTEMNGLENRNKMKCADLSKSWFWLNTQWNGPASGESEKWCNSIGI